MINEATFDRFAPGTSVRFRRTNGDTTIGYAYGVVLATGCQPRGRYSFDVLNRPAPNMYEDGALIAWDEDHHNRNDDIRVTFVPFWNERLQPVRSAARSPVFP